LRCPPQRRTCLRLRRPPADRRRQELPFDYAMRNFTIDHFPAVCLCGAAQCRGSVTGWKDLAAARKADYGELVAPYLRTMDDEARRALQQAAGG
ncbi:MAG: hypothetical protein M3Q93_06255, partial [Gemmatimonadota bacterium]|nr:hypothetical protein [Gemmatimonadota bacterium]